MSKDNGGPAFPNYGVWSNGCWEPMPQEGMSLRDYFAGQAMIGLITKLPPDDMVEFKQQVAESAYRYADAMLKARGE